MSPTPSPKELEGLARASAEQDRLVRARVRVAALRERLQTDPAIQVVPTSYVAEYHEAICGVVVNGRNLDDFQMRTVAAEARGIDRLVFLSKLDALLDYLPLSFSGFELPNLAGQRFLDSKTPRNWFQRVGYFFRRPWEQTPTRRDVDREKSWSWIAGEVRARKQLLLAAAQELRDRNIPNEFTLATVDVFVEKAQKQLSDRAESYRLWGTITALAALAIIAAGIAFLSQTHVTDQLGLTTVNEHGTRVLLDSPMQLNQYNPWQMSLVLLKASTIAGFFAGAVMYLIFISRALLHEMVVLYQRRHALRFGRLFVYLYPDKLTVEELQEAFNWNAEYRSAFKDIRADKIMQGVPGKLLETAVELAHASAEVLKQAKTVRESTSDKEE